MEQKTQSHGQRWTESRPTKTAVFRACVGTDGQVAEQGAKLLMGDPS